MKKILTLLAILAATPAVAADMAVKTPMARPASVQIYDWTGFYLGLNAGGGWNHNCWNLNGYNVPVSPLGPNGPFIGVSNSANIAEGCNDASGAMVGGQVGYRQQFGSFVFGLEAQGDWANISGSNTSNLFSGFANSNFAKWSGSTLTLTNTSKVNAIGMFTGQVGYTVLPALLWYVKGGAAVTDNSYSGSLNFNFPGKGEYCPPIAFSATDGGKEIKFGGVVGTGVEWAFAPDWSIGAEYNHLFMGTRDVGLNYTGASLTVGKNAVNLVSPAGIPSRHESISSDLDLATVRLNYRFSSH